MLVKKSIKKNLNLYSTARRDMRPRLAVSFTGREEIKMKKMVYAVIFLSLAGCGGGDGDANPKTSTSNSSSNSINPLAAGAGTFSMRKTFGEPVGILKPSFMSGVSINETTGGITYHKNTLKNTLSIAYSAADTDTSGMVLAVYSSGAANTTIDEIDFINGTTRTLFTAPENLTGIAVGSDDVIVGISKGGGYIYRFNKSGVVLSKVKVSGISAGTKVGIDFDKNGVLYGVDVDGLWKIDATTGAAQLVSSTPASPSSSVATDIDIDSNNTIRLIDSTGLSKFSVTGGTLQKRVALQNYNDDAEQTNVIVHR